MKRIATHDYRLAQVATALAATVASGLFGWAIALALGLWGDAQMTKLSPWRPFALQEPTLGAAVASSPVSTGTARLVGVAGNRAYFMTGTGAAQRSLSLGAGDALPSGEKIVRVERDAIVVAAGGLESRVTVFGVRADPVKKAPLLAAGTTAALNCRLTGTDRSAAIFIDPNMVKALSAERATFARMFEPQPGAGGVRAKGTGGTTAMFAILDGDVLLRADGAPIKSSDAIISDVLARVERGNSVVVEGERNGAPRRWVYAPAGCAATPSASPLMAKPAA